MSELNPILLIHGLNDTRSVFGRMSNYLSELGWDVHSINLTPNNGAATLERLAHQVSYYIEQNFSRQQPIDLLGFSMGGIITRYYLQRLGGVERVERYISISAPNNGTVTAYGLPLPGILQMQPNSSFLEDLNRDVRETLSRLKITIMWTPFDLMILPAHSSQLPLGKELRLPVVLHPWMLKDSRTLAAVASSLRD
jgi:triacylglycerol lipase